MAALRGELHSGGQLPRRLNEAAKLGFSRGLVPKTATRKLELALMPEMAETK